MSCNSPLDCNDEQRRALLPPGLQGIDGVETVYPLAAPFVPSLRIYFFNGWPTGIEALASDAFRFAGGGRVPGNLLKVFSIENAATAQADGYLQVKLNRDGDFSSYRLSIDFARLDPVYRCAAFDLKAGCPNPFDCQTERFDGVEETPDLPIADLARDYASFRAALLDFLQTRLPPPVETNPADAVMAMIELFAYQGDRLAYFQDAVFNEAYLETARQRASLKKHARLVDYRVHEGQAARTFVHFQAEAGQVSQNVPARFALQTTDSRQAPEQQIHFETDRAVTMRSAHNEIGLYTWGNQSCCLEQAPQAPIWLETFRLRSRRVIFCCLKQCKDRFGIIRPAAFCWLRKPPTRRCAGWHGWIRIPC